MAIDLSLTSPRNLWLAHKAKSYGMQNSLRIVVEAKRYGLPVSLGFAVIEKESTNGANVFGHDDTTSIPEHWKGSTVTKDKYLYYKGRRGRYGMQGVGPAQLTWYAIQDAADKRGGCHIPRHNIAEGFARLAHLIQVYGEAKGIERYNGSGPKAVAYSRDVRVRADKWHRRLT